MQIRWQKTPLFIQKLFPNYIWKIPTTEKKVFLTFDDGPTPEITEWVLAELEKYNAKATFFCIGNNIEKYPEIFEKLITNNHSVGNHTFNHLNGWKTKTGDYIKNVIQAEHFFLNTNPVSSELNTVNCKLFRPPYGKIKPSQSKKLRQLGYKIIMWDIISYDFDENYSKEKCLQKVIRNISPGSIIVFHDSKKAFKNLEYVLPRTLQFLKENGYNFEKIQ